MDCYLSSSKVTLVPGSLWHPHHLPLPGFRISIRQSPHPSSRSWGEPKVCQSITGKYAFIDGQEFQSITLLYAAACKPPQWALSALSKATPRPIGNLHTNLKTFYVFLFPHSHDASRNMVIFAQVYSGLHPRKFGECMIKGYSHTALTANIICLSPRFMYLGAMPDVLWKIVSVPNIWGGVPEW